jgi:hypothetical protein
VSPEEVLGVLRPIYERGKRSMADHVRSYIRWAYSWGLKAEHDYRSATPRRFWLVLNPAGAIQDISSKSYDRWNYMPEKRAGMKKWDAWVTKLLTKKAPKDAA